VAAVAVWRAHRFPFKSWCTACLVIPSSRPIASRLMPAVCASWTAERSATWASVSAHAARCRASCAVRRVSVGLGIAAHDRAEAKRDGLRAHVGQRAAVRLG
jgi:hypothetical protein